MTDWRRCGCLWLGLLLAGTVMAQDVVAPADLLKRAEAARQRAEQDLAGTRQRHIAERRALADSLKDAYAQLDAARARRKTAAAQLTTAQTRAADLERESLFLKQEVDDIVHQAARLVGFAPLPSADLSEVETDLTTVLSKRLATWDHALEASVQTRTVAARDGQRVAVPVLRLGAFAEYACGDGPDRCGLLRESGEDEALVTGATLSPEQAALLRARVAGTATALPIDVDGSLIQRLPREATTLRSWLKTGGLFVYPILAVAAAALLLILERLLYLSSTRRDEQLVRDVVAWVGQGDMQRAAERTQGSRGPTARVLAVGVAAHDQPDEAREAMMESALLAEAPRMERSISLLGALASVAPLLGLLGTVSGMIATFATISVTGTGNPRLLSGGISEALITTQLGLMVGIPLLLMHAWIGRSIERREAILECDAIQVFGLHHREGRDPS